MTKRILCTLLAMILCLGVPTFAQEEISYLFSLNFNADKIDAKPSGFDDVISGNKDEILVSDPLGKGDNAVKFESTSFGNAVLHKALGGSLFDGADNAVISFDVMIEKYGSGSGYFAPYSYDSNSLGVYYVKINEGGDLICADGSVLAKLMCGKFYKIALSVNFKEHSMDVYLNHKLLKENSYISENLSKIGFLRFSMDKCQNDGDNPIYYLDNPAVYIASAPEFVLNRSTDATLSSTGGETAMEKFMSGTTCFYVNQDTYAHGGKVEKFDEDNENVKTIVYGGTSFTPADTLVKELSLTYSQDENALSVTNGVKTLTLSATEYTEHEDLLYLPIRKVAQFF